MDFIKTIQNIQKIQDYCNTCCEDTLPTWWRIKAATVEAYLDLLAASLPEMEIETEAEDQDEVVEEPSTNIQVLEPYEGIDLALLPPTVKMVRQI